MRTRNKILIIGGLLLAFLLVSYLALALVTGRIDVLSLPPELLKLEGLVALTLWGTFSIILWGVLGRIERKK